MPLHENLGFLTHSDSSRSEQQYLFEHSEIYLSVRYSSLKRPGFLIIYIVYVNHTPST